MKDDELAEAIVRDHTTAALDERRHALLTFADKLTMAPGSMTGEDAQALRSVGFEDPEILAIVEVTSYYAYANRIVDGLGVELE